MDEAFHCRDKASVLASVLASGGRHFCFRTRIEILPDFRCSQHPDGFHVFVMRALILKLPHSLRIEPQSRVASFDPLGHLLTLVLDSLFFRIYVLHSFDSCTNMNFFKKVDPKEAARQAKRETRKEVRVSTNSSACFGGCVRRGRVAMWLTQKCARFSSPINETWIERFERLIEWKSK